MKPRRKSGTCSVNDLLARLCAPLVAVVVSCFASGHVSLFGEARPSGHGRLAAYERGGETTSLKLWLTGVALGRRALTREAA
jgi:hypothetical protein